jgi:hypothetical protein
MTIEEVGKISLKEKIVCMSGVDGTSTVPTVMLCA